MVVKEIEWEIPETEGLSGEVIKSKYWEFPVESLGAWRPRTAYIDYRFFLGPHLGPREKGLGLNQDLVLAVHGPRGATKTMTMSYFLAKKMRMGQPAWANYPISFYVIEPDCIDHCKKCYENPWLCGASCHEGCFTYYENMPLDLDKFYRFSHQLRNGNAAITEFQYYVESRTSGKVQNRLASYQIMQIRKTALSFFYDVQNPQWVDKRFAWSDDTVLTVNDISIMNYDYNSVGHYLQKGERSLWHIEDRSGVLTGKQGSMHGPVEFRGWTFRNIYPTHWIVDAYDAMNSFKAEEMEKVGKENKDEAIAAALSLAVNTLAQQGKTEVLGDEIWSLATELGHVKVSPQAGGKILGLNGITSKQKKRKYYYNLSPLIEAEQGQSERSLVAAQ